MNKQIEGIFTFEIYQNPYTGMYYVSVSYTDEQFDLFMDENATLEEAQRSMKFFIDQLKGYKTREEYEKEIFGDAV